MSTNHTPNLNLSQWVRSDQVLMDDFNADNAKIDAAIFNYCAGELITDVTVEEETYMMQLDVSQVDWSRYLMVILTANAPTKEGFHVQLGDNNVCTYILGSSPSPGSDSSFGRLYEVSRMDLAILVLYDGSRLPASVSFGCGDRAVLCSGFGTTPLEQCSTLYIRRDNTSARFQPGDKLTLWGVK